MICFPNKIENKKINKGTSLMIHLFLNHIEMPIIFFIENRNKERRKSSSNNRKVR